MIASPPDFRYCQHCQDRTHHIEIDGEWVCAHVLKEKPATFERAFAEAWRVY